MKETLQLQELTDTANALILLAEAIINQTKKGDLDAAKICFDAMKICAPDLINDCERFLN